MKKKVTVNLPANGLGKATGFLGTKYFQGHDNIALSQRKQIERLIDEWCLTNSRNVTVLCGASIDFSPSDDNQVKKGISLKKDVKWSQIFSQWQ